jgi:hypothetical protein
MNDLWSTMNSLKNITSGINYLNANVLLDCMDVTGPLFLDIINTSLQQGVVPNEWKKSTVVPIQKVSGTRKCEKIRPINVKISECIVKQQFSKYLDDNNVLVDEQLGFRAVH